MPKHILLVDDESKFLSGLRRVLFDEEPGWDVDAAHSVDCAMGLLTRATYDAVVSDVTMPGKDGFALIQEMQQSTTTRNVPVIILTGMDDTELKRRALALGAVDLLNKPVHTEDLLARIRNVLKLKEYQDQLRDCNLVLEQRVSERTAELARSRLDIIWRLGKAGEHRDEETGSHVVRVGCYSRALADSLGLDAELVDELFLASPLHDIGKIGVPDSVLRKRGRLNAEEWVLMRKHCEIGARILGEDSQMMQTYQRWNRPGSTWLVGGDKNEVLALASDIALNHHEWWNGKGYPRGLAGKDIPLTARIVSIADTYDALRSQRPYKPALSEEEALRIIRSERGTHFDPQVCEAFEAIAHAFDEIHAEFGDVPSEQFETEHAL